MESTDNLYFYDMMCCKMNEVDMEELINIAKRLPIDSVPRVRLE